MKTEEIKDLFQKFESIACDYEGVECWSARELCGLLGYAKWERFEGVIAKAKEACLNAGERIEDHFPGAGKMVLNSFSSIQTCLFRFGNHPLETFPLGIPKQPTQFAGTPTFNTFVITCD